jgi:hypothetical protein
VWKNSLRRYKVVRTPEQKIKRKVLPPCPEDKIMVLQSCWDLEVKKQRRKMLVGFVPSQSYFRTI